MGGAGIEVATGRGTQFERFGNDGGVVFGEIVTSDDHKGVPGGIALVTVARNTRLAERYVTVQTEVKNGFLRTVVEKDPDWRVVRAEYLPPAGFGPCEVGWTKRV